MSFQQQPDPFAGAPAWQPADIAGNQIQPPATQTIAFQSGSGVSITFKGRAGFDSPWIVIHATSLEDAYQQVFEKATLLSKLMQQVKLGADYYSGLFNPGQSAQPQRQQREAAPPQAQQPPPGSPPCPPGWTYKSGSRNDGTPYQGYVPPRGIDAKPIWF